MDSFTFLEPPATKEELEIAEFLKKLAEAVSKKNFALLDSLIADEATILLDSGVVVTKKEYLDKREKKILNVRSVNYKNIYIRIANKWEASVYCTRVMYHYRNAIPTLVDRIFKLRKKKTWVLTKAFH